MSAAYRPDTPTCPSGPSGPDDQPDRRVEDRQGADGLEELVVAPGYQAALLPGRPGRTARWRSVRRDGTRFPLVGELGVVIAQAKTLAGADGYAWIVGSDHHAIEIRLHRPVTASNPAQEPNLRGGFTVHGCGPRWTHTVRRSLTT